jgi:hypothetical protein
VFVAILIGIPEPALAVALRMPCGANTSLSGGAYGFESVSSGRLVKNVLGRGPTVNGFSTKEEGREDCLDPDEVNVMNMMKKNTSPAPNVSMSILFPRFKTIFFNFIFLLI